MNKRKIGMPEDALTKGNVLQLVEEMIDWFKRRIRDQLKYLRRCLSRDSHGTYSWVETDVVSV